MDSHPSNQPEKKSSAKNIATVLPNLIWKQLPLLFLRILGILFSIIVFGCISNRGGLICSFENVCDFSIAIGVIAFLFCLGLLAKDIVTIMLGVQGKELNQTFKLALPIADGIVNGVLALLWFAVFCYAADEARKINELPFSVSLSNCFNIGVAFSFFSIIVSGAIVGVNGYILLNILRESDLVTLPGFLKSKSGAATGGEDNAPQATIPPTADNP